MATRRSAGRSAAEPGRRPADLAALEADTDGRGLVIRGAPRRGARAAPKKAAPGKRATAPKKTRPKARRARGRAQPEDRRGPTLTLLWLVILLAWCVPAFRPDPDAGLPSALILHLFVVAGVALWSVAGPPMRWVLPGLLAVLSVLWAAAIAPELLVGDRLGPLWPLWPEPPQSRGAALLWRLIALTLAAIVAIRVALPLLPRPERKKGKGRR